MIHEEKIIVHDKTLTLSIISQGSLDAKAPTVLFLHGFSSTGDRYVPRAEKMVKEIGGIYVTFSMRGHGSDKANLDHYARKDHVEDCLAVYDFLLSKPFVDKEHMAICGSSYGGYLAAVLSAERNVQWLVLREPALYKDEGFDVPTPQLINEDLQAFRQQNISPQENRALRALQKFSGEVLLIESEIHDVIPHETIENYKKALEGKNYTFEFMKGADHALLTPGSDDAFVEVMIKWFKNRFKKSPKV